MADGNRTFNIKGNYIESQTINVNDGGKLFFGVPENNNKPEAEDTPEELRLALEKYKEAGIVDDDLQPIGLSNTEKAVLASVVACRLWKENRWRPFENLWNIKGLGSYYAKALEQKKTNNLIDTYKRALK